VLSAAVTGKRPRLEVLDAVEQLSMSADGADVLDLKVRERGALGKGKRNRVMNMRYSSYFHRRCCSRIRDNSLRSAPAGAQSSGSLLRYDASACPEQLHDKPRSFVSCSSLATIQLH